MKDARLNRRAMLAIAVVCLTLVVLVAMLLPSLGAARSTARRMSSSNESAGIAHQVLQRSAGNSADAQGDTRLVIHEAYLQLRVSDPRREAGEVEALLAGYEGFVESSNIRETRHEGRYTAELSLRVPASRLDNLLTELRNRADRVLHEQRQAEDVTDQHADLEARLRNLRHAEEELRELMRTLRQRADEVEEVMHAYRELIQIREQIERSEARLERMEQQVAMATVNVHLLAPDVPASVADPEWSAAGVTSHASWTLVRGLQVLATVGIYAVVAGLPIALIVLVPLLVVGVGIRRTRGWTMPCAGSRNCSNTRGRSCNGNWRIGRCCWRIPVRSFRPLPHPRASRIMLRHWRCWSSLKPLWMRTKRSTFRPATGRS